jgi:hypothetical protein
VVELRAVEPVADVQVADLRDPQTGEICVQLGQWHARGGDLDAPLSDRETPRGLRRDAHHEQRRRDPEHAEHDRTGRAQRERRSAEQRIAGPARDHREADDQRRNAALDVDPRQAAAAARAARALQRGHDRRVGEREDERHRQPQRGAAARPRERNGPHPVRDQRLEQAERNGEIAHEPGQQHAAEESGSGDRHRSEFGRTASLAG